MEQNKLGLSSSIGVSFILSILIGAGIGYWLDEQFDTKPAMLIIMMFVGVGAGFRNLFILTKRFENDN